MRIKDCPECVDYFDSHPHLVEACASVGISHNKSTREMVAIFLSGYHSRGHVERDGLDHEVAAQVLPADVRPDSSADVA